MTSKELKGNKTYLRSNCGGSGSGSPTVRPRKKHSHGSNMPPRIDIIDMECTNTATHNDTTDDIDGVNVIATNNTNTATKTLLELDVSLLLLINNALNCNKSLKSLVDIAR